jgi:hypothetical protein
MRWNKPNTIEKHSQACTLGMRCRQCLQSDAKLITFMMEGGF